MGSSAVWTLASRLEAEATRAGTAPRLGALILVMVLVPIACGPGVDVRTRPTTELVDGVEIAIVPDLPSPLDAAFAWELEVVRTVATVDRATGEPLLFDPVAVLPLRGGGLLFCDPSADRPLVLIDPASGTVRSAFGRMGQGPGELGGCAHLAQRGDDEVVVVDRLGRRLERFGLDGTWAGGQALDLTFVPTGGGALQPGTARYLLSGLDQDRRMRSIVAADLDRGRVEHVLELPGPDDRRSPSIQGGRAVWTVLGEGIVTMWTDRPTVLLYDFDGALAREIRLPLTRRELSERAIQAEVARVGEIAGFLRPGPAALTNEVYVFGDSIFGMLLSDLWRAEEDPPLTGRGILWRLFTARGEYLGVLHPPDGYRPLGRSVGEGTVWARSLDAIGIPIVKELRLVRQR